MLYYVIGMILALGLGVYIGLGFPGLPGRENRVITSGRARRARRHFTPLDLLRPPRR